jgi:hypothetical protein
MPITVNTNGPINSSSSTIFTTDPTFSDLMFVIFDEIDDTTEEYSSQVQNAILGAIRFCEREQYYFNETRDVTFDTVAGQQWYDGTANSNIPTLGRIVEAYLELPSGERRTMRRVTPEEVELLSDNSASRGEPYCWTYFGQRLRIYPIPSDTVYTIRLQLGPYRLAKISDTSDSNAWVVEAFDMIKARAKYILQKDILKDAALATEALNDYNDQHDALKAETSRRNSSGFIRVTCF